MRSDVVAVFAAIALVGCARSAPPLPSSQALAPVHMNEAERVPYCAELHAKIDASQKKTNELEAIIAGNRVGNQTIGYVAAVAFPPLALAAQENSAEKKELDRLQAERDALYPKLRAAGCA
jgi:hypothetical protein